MMKKYEIFPELPKLKEVNKCFWENNINRLTQHKIAKTFKM